MIKTSLVSPEAGVYFLNGIPCGGGGGVNKKLVVGGGKNVKIKKTENIFPFYPYLVRKN